MSAQDGGSSNPRRISRWGHLFWKPPATEEQTEANNFREYNANFIELMIRIGLIGFLVYWTAVIVYPFAPIIAWSVVMTVALYPAFERLSVVFGDRRALAATLLTLFGLLIVVGPVTWFGIDLVEVSKRLIAKLNSGELSIPRPSEAIKDWPLIGQQLFDYWTLASTNLRSALAPIFPQMRPLGEKLLEVASSAGIGSMKFLVSVVVMGFLFLPGPSLVAAGKDLAFKIDKARGVGFVELAGATIRAVSRGVIGISLLQAVVSGIGLSLTGVPGASVLTLIILVLGIVQIGPGIVAIPVVLWGWATMPIMPALALTVCMGTVSFMDGFLKPFFLGHGLTTPTLVTFVGVIGGILAHGIIGLFIGPIVLAVAWNLAEAWIHDREVAQG